MAAVESRIPLPAMPIKKPCNSRVFLLSKRIYQSSATCAGVDAEGTVFGFPLASDLGTLFQRLHAHFRTGEQSAHARDGGRISLVRTSNLCNKSRSVCLAIHGAVPMCCRKVLRHYLGMYIRMPSILPGFRRPCHHAHRPTDQLGGAVAVLFIIRHNLCEWLINHYLRRVEVGRDDIKDNVDGHKATAL